MSGEEGAYFLSEGGSPEEDANTKEIRNAEVNVLSMCGSAGTAASVLAIPPRRELELRWHGSERTHQAPWAGTRLRAILITI
jgi:hypothetical protein